MTEELLLKSVQLAKEGQASQARQLIEDYTRQNPFDVRGWWVMANVVEDTASKRTALQKVLELKPDNTKARALLEELDLESVFDLADVPPPDDTYRKFTQRPMRPAVGIRAADVLLVSGTLLIVLVFVIGIAWYAYTYQHRGLWGLFGPDLSKEAKTAQYSMRYPDDWDGRIIKFQGQNQDVILVASDGINSLTELMTQQPSPDAAIAAIAGGNLTGVNPAIIIEDNPNPSEDDTQEFLQNFTVLLFAPASPEQLTSLQNQLDVNTSTAESANLFGIEFNVETEQDAISIGGTEGDFRAVHVSLKFPDELTEQSDGQAVDEISFSYYLANAQRGGQNYVFVMIALEEEPGERERTARHMIRSIQFE